MVVDPERRTSGADRSGCKAAGTRPKPAVTRVRKAARTRTTLGLERDTVVNLRAQHLVQKELVARAAVYRRPAICGASYRPDLSSVERHSALSYVPIMVLSLRGRILRPIGHLARANAAGALPRLGCAPVGRLGGIVTDFAKALHARLGDPGLSVVLRGSLARGGRSPADIDLMLISAEPPTLPAIDTLPSLPLPVELVTVPLDRFRDPVIGAWPRFALAHSGWTIAGPDMLSELPEPTVGPVVIAHLRGVRNWWPRHPEDWACNEAERRLINGWLAKRIIRSLAEGEMARRAVYSRDIWPCVQLANSAFPEHSALLIDIAEQAIRPSGKFVDRTRLLSAGPLLERAYAMHLRQPLKLPC